MNIFSQRVKYFFPQQFHYQKYEFRLEKFLKISKNIHKSFFRWVLRDKTEQLFGYYFHGIIIFLQILLYLLNHTQGCHEKLNSNLFNVLSHNSMKCHPHGSTSFSHQQCCLVNGFVERQFCCELCERIDQMFSIEFKRVQFVKCVSVDL